MDYIKQEFKKLTDNKWLTEDEAELFYSNELIKECINTSTSPQRADIFNALKNVSFDSVKVVILGKDPYPNPKDAHGLAFSSKDSQTPDSLKNIFKAIDNAYGSNLFEKQHNDLTKWSKTGVLLLNTGLTYRKLHNPEQDKKQALSNQNKIQTKHMRIWKPFVKTIIKKILTIKNRPVVMMLWGNDAHNIVFSNIKDKEFKSYIHSREAVIVPQTSVMLLQTSHPSPLSVNTGGDFPEIAPIHFRKSDEYLAENKIIWTEL